MSMSPEVQHCITLNVVNAIEIRGRIMFDFYAGLPHTFSMGGSRLFQ